MKLKSLLLIPLCAVFMCACGDATNVDEVHDEIEELVDEEISDESDTDTEVASTIEGVYTNGDGGTLTISNLRDNDGQEMFDFRFTSESANEDCAGIDYEGEANYDGDLSAISSDDEAEDAFTFGKSFDKVNFEPDMSMIGMDCMRVLATDFSK
jgi:hypothetical protein